MADTRVAGKAPGQRGGAVLQDQQLVVRIVLGQEAADGLQGEIGRSLVGMIAVTSGRGRGG